MPVFPGPEHTAPAWLFDLDNTLYSPTTGLFDQVRRRIGTYLEEALSLSAEESTSVQRNYRERYGSTLAGMMAEHNADPHAFLDYVHDVDYSVVKKDDALATALAALPGRKFIFTNGTVAHARRVTDELGISAAFAEVFDIVRADFVPKPMPAPYRALVDDFDIDPANTVLIEDMAVNLAPARQMGMTTVLVTPNEATADAADFVIDDLLAWLNEQSGADVDSPSSPAILPRANDRTVR